MDQDLPSARSGRLSRTAASELLDAWTASGLSAARFARRQGIAAQTLYRWHHRLRRGSPHPDLCQVVSAGSPPTDDGSGGIVVALSSGVRIEVGPASDERTLRLVLRVLSC